jgi:hypothetical protein
MDFNKFVREKFPSFKLSYEKIIHNKVDKSDFILAVPFGQKYFVWFTLFQNKRVCLLLEENKETKKFHFLRQLKFSCLKELNNNTILFGTNFQQNGQQYFSIENIYFYKNEDLKEKNWLQKYQIILQLLSKEIKQTKESFFIFGLPLFSNSFCNLEKEVKENSLYNVYSYQSRAKEKTGSLVFKNNKRKKEEEKIEFDQNDMLDILFEKNKKPKIEKEKTKKFVKQQILLVKPDIQNDVYHLYSFDENTKDFTNYENVAAIPDYETSVLLNNIFRKIKENINLDALEESDDEDEFEDSREDRFVDLKKEAKFVCDYNFKFKKWVPIKLNIE